MARNPFTPTFGASPPALVGRDEEVSIFAEALEDGPGAPGRAMLITGVRGSGKTVLLNAIEDEARRHGWLVVADTARPGLARDMTTSALPRLLRDHHQEPTTTRITGADATIAGFGAGVDRDVTDNFPVEPTLRSQLDALTDALARHDTGGVLISIDEVHKEATEDLRQITQAVQHAFREGREVALVGAGLPSAVQSILSDATSTFLRRAERFVLGAVSLDQVRAAIEGPMIAAGRHIGADALNIAAGGTQGYPFLVQLVGHQSWNIDRASPEITIDHARAGVQRAMRRVGRMVHEPALAELSPVDRSFLAAMAADGGPSRMHDIAQRLGVDANYAAQYRLRLLAAEMIHAPQYGTVDFTLPYLRDYLRQHAPITVLREVADPPAPGIAADGGESGRSGRAATRGGPSSRRDRDRKSDTGE